MNNIIINIIPFFMKQDSLVKYVPLIRIGYGIILLIIAYLKWMPAFTDNFTRYFYNSSIVQPKFLDFWFSLWHNIIFINPMLFVYNVATLETILSICVLLGFAKRVVYIVGLFLSIIVFSTFDGFGIPSISKGIDMGTGILFFIIFLFLLLTNKYTSNRLSIDGYILKKFNNWSKVA